MPPVTLFVRMTTAVVPGPPTAAALSRPLAALDTGVEKPLSVYAYKLYAVEVTVEVEIVNETFSRPRVPPAFAVTENRMSLPSATPVEPRLTAATVGYVRSSRTPATAELPVE